METSREYSPRRSVLLADDDPDIRAIMRLELRDAPFIAHFACDGEIALDDYEAAIQHERPYDLLVLDAAMPVYSGLAVAEKIRASGDKATRIILLSGDSSPITYARATIAGIEAMWKKPEDVSLLRERICELLGL